GVTLVIRYSQSRHMVEFRRKILCVEDDVETASLISDELIDRGYAVTIAHNGREGLTSIYREKPDLVLCDVGVPVMSGFELLERLTAVAPRFGAIRFVFVTA